MYALTMLPISVEPRAKKKIISRQPPWVNSFSVVPTRSKICLVSIGPAAASAARAERANVYFILKGMWVLKWLESECVCSRQDERKTGLASVRWLNYISRLSCDAYTYTLVCQVFTEALELSVYHHWPR